MLWFSWIVSYIMYSSSCTRASVILNLGTGELVWDVCHSPAWNRRASVRRHSQAWNRMASVWQAVTYKNFPNQIFLEGTYTRPSCFEIVRITDDIISSNPTQDRRNQRADRGSHTTPWITRCTFIFDPSSKQRSMCCPSYPHSATKTPKLLISKVSWSTLKLRLCWFDIFG